MQPKVLEGQRTKWDAFPATSSPILKLNPPPTGINLDSETIIVTRVSIGMTLI